MHMTDHLQYMIIMKMKCCGWNVLDQVKTKDVQLSVVAVEVTDHLQRHPPSSQVFSAGEEV